MYEASIKHGMTFRLNSPITEEQWDAITDVDFEHTDRIWFSTKHGKEVEFVKRKKGKWIYGEDEYGIDGYHCDKCGFFVPWDYAHTFINYIEDYNFCPNCGADMRGEQDG